MIYLVTCAIDEYPHTVEFTLRNGKLWYNDTVVIEEWLGFSQM